jgi:hypothetical protein
MAYALAEACDASAAASLDASAEAALDPDPTDVFAEALADALAEAVPDSLLSESLSSAVVPLPPFAPLSLVELPGAPPEPSLPGAAPPLPGVESPGVPLLVPGA